MAAILKAVARMDLSTAESLINQAESGANAEEKEVLTRMRQSVTNLKSSLTSSSLSEAEYLKRAADSADRWHRGRSRSDLESAIKDLHAILILNPNQLQAMTELARLLHDDGALEAARDWQVTALGKAKPGYLSTAEGMQWQAARLKMIAWTSVILGDFALAKKFASLAVSKYPQSSALHHTLGAACMGLGEIDQAIGHLDLAVSFAEKDPRTGSVAAALGDRGIAKLRAGKVPEGVADLKRALSTAPEHTGAVRWIEALGLVASHAPPPGIEKPNSPAPTKTADWNSAFAVLSQRVLTAKEVSGWDFAQLRLAINFLYAKHGYVSRSGEVQAMFEGKPWYRAVPGMSMEDIDAKMSAIEAANVKVLARAKKGGVESDFSVLSQRVLTTEEVSGWDFSRLRYAINFLYAKHGYVSRTREIQAVFEAKPWYRPAPGVTMAEIDARMSVIEVANVRVLAEAKSRLKR